MRQSVPKRTARLQRRADRGVGVDHGMHLVPDLAERIIEVEQRLFEPAQSTTQHDICDAERRS
jgi:hypothetical protein